MNPNGQQSKGHGHRCPKGYARYNILLTISKFKGRDRHLPKGHGSYNVLLVTSKDATIMIRIPSGGKPLVYKIMATVLKETNK